MNLRVISKDEIRRVAPMGQTIELVKQAFAQLSAGEAEVPVRTQIEVAPHEGIALFMPAYLRKTDQMGLKIVSVFPRNLESGIPTIHALITVVDAATGQPTAVMDGTYLTALRTGAASGAATELLARTDSRVLAILGAGVQGRTQLEAVCAVREITRVCVFDVNREASDAFAEEMQARGGRIPTDIAVASSAQEAVRQADIICTTTTSREPVFDDSDLAQGTHINAVGAFTPDTRETPEETIQRAELFVDSREACWAEAGDLIIPRAKGLVSDTDIQAELGELVLGTKPGRSTSKEVTFFKSVGNAVQDVAVAAHVMAEAVRLGLGTDVEV
jgi:ornithine cyclodeaminase